MINQCKQCLVIVATSLLISATAYAKDVSLNDKLLACSQIGENQARLKCFDAFVEKHHLVGKAIKKVNPAIKAKPSSQAIDAFAKEQVKKTAEERAKELTTVTLTISSLSKTVYGKWKIRFKNGQKWLQKDSGKIKLKVGQRVVLTKGALSSVYLKKENTNKRISVKRLK